MRKLVENAFQYIKPEHGLIDPVSGYPFEGWNDDPQRGLFLRSFTQITAIGQWIELLANIAAGQADNNSISREDATVERVMSLLDRRVVLVAYGDNVNLTTSVAKTIGALLNPDLKDNPTASAVRSELEAFLEAQAEGYRLQIPLPTTPALDAIVKLELNFQGNNKPKADTFALNQISFTPIEEP
jgi:hypothetical protein